MTDSNDSPTVKTTSKEIFVPRSVAQRCPVCNGFGTLKYGSLICHGCKGRGYILVPAEKEGVYDRK